MQSVHEEIMDYIASTNAGDAQADVSKDNDPAPSPQDTVSAGEPEREPVDSEAQAPEAGDADGGEADSEGTEPEAKEADGKTASVEYDVTLPDGTVQKIPVEELQKSYLRQEDYTRKTQELSQERQQFDVQAGEIRQKQVAVLEGLQQRYQQLDPLNIISQQREAAMKIGDIEEANRLGLVMVDVEKKLRQVDQAVDFEKQKDAENGRQSDVEYLAQQRQAIFSKLPILSTPEGGQKFQAAVSKAMQKVGYTAEELQAMTRPEARTAELAYYAGLYLQSQEAKPAVLEAIKGKVINPAPQGRQNTQTASKQAAIQRFDRLENPTIEDYMQTVF